MAEQNIDIAKETTSQSILNKTMTIDGKVDEIKAGMSVPGVEDITIHRSERKAAQNVALGEATIIDITGKGRFYFANIRAVSGSSGNNGFNTRFVLEIDGETIADATFIFPNEGSCKGYDIGIINPTVQQINIDEGNTVYDLIAGTYYSTTDNGTFCGSTNSGRFKLGTPQTFTPTYTNSGRTNGYFGMIKNYIPFKQRLKIKINSGLSSSASSGLTENSCIGYGLDE